MSLSSLLVQREVATIRDVEEALARQVLYGGDLVTNLLESSKIDETRLVEVLGETTGLRPAGGGTLAPASEQARALVPRDLADKRNFLPLGFTEDGEQLILAVAEPLTVEDDEQLMFSLGIPIIQRVAPLVRIREGLARDYGASLDRRFDRLVRRLRGEPVESLAPPGVKPKTSAPAQALITDKKKSLPRTTNLKFPAPQGHELPPQTPRPLPKSASDSVAPPSRTLAREGSPAPRPPRRRRGPLTFDTAKRELDALEDRDALLDLYFDFSRQYFDYAALFVVHGDLAEGRDAYGSGASRDRVAAIGVPLDLPSLLSVAKERAVPVVSPVSDSGIDAIFAADIARPPGGEVIIVPLVVRRRTVALLYGDSHDSGAPVENPSDVTTFALLVGQAFERIIVKKKFGSSDRAIPRMVHVSVRDAANEDRNQRALALSRALHEPPPSQTVPAPPPVPEPEPEAAAEAAPLSGPPVTDESQRSPAAVSVPPPPPDAAAGSRSADSAPPPANVLLVRRPSGPPIPREDPIDPTSRPPEQVFTAPRVPSELRSSRPPPALRVETPTEPLPPVTAALPPTTRSAELEQQVLAPPISPLAMEPEPVFANEEDDDDVATGGPKSGPPPARIDAEELAPREAERLLAELEGEELDDDDIEDASPASVIPASQTVVVAAHRPPTSRTDTENLPTIMVDVSAELEVLVRDILAGKNEEKAEQELLRQGAAAMPAILASFPGPTQNEPQGDEEFFPPFSTCGPVLRLVAAQRKVALPYVLPIATEEREERRFWATFSLTELAYPEAMAVVLPRLFDESKRVRKAARLAVAATSRAHGEHVARELGRYARDPQNDRRRRMEIMQLLEDIREPLAVPTFISLLDDGDQQIADRARGALEVIARQELGVDPKKWKSWWNSHSSRHRIEWLIDSLMHESLTIRRVASEELKAITKEYFGYYADESKRDREKAQARYREWWANEGRLKFVVN
jgi:hypothetical protein